LTTGKDIAMDLKLVVIGGKNQGREIPIARPQFLIGRSDGCQLRPASDRVSRKHCVILVETSRVLLRDLKSTNHTFVNQEPVTGDWELKNGDRLNVAGVLEFEVRLHAEAGGKKKPKIHSIQEAVARTVQSAAAEELDITEWLENEGGAAPPPPAVDPGLKSTRADQSLADTTTFVLPHRPDEEKKDDEKKDEKKKSGKILGKFKRKPSGETSQEAADDMLRQFFGRKRP
jgi:pSer/pThr/pTyr-binding forkhead associated (FHA) protein